MNRDHSPLNLSDETLLHVSLEQIIPNPKQPRKHFSQKTLLELAQSIRTQGILQALVVRKHQNLTNRYELVAGERRWRALNNLKYMKFRLCCEKLAMMKCWKCLSWKIVSEKI